MPKDKSLTSLFGEQPPNKYEFNPELLGKSSFDPSVWKQPTVEAAARAPLAITPLNKTDYNRFKGDKNFPFLGYSILRDNESLFDAQQTGWQWAKNTMGRLGSRSWNMFKDGFNAPVDFKSIDSILASDVETQKEIEEKLQNDFPTYNSPYTKTGFPGFFSAGAHTKWSQLIDQAGFTVGLMGSAIVQDYLLGLATGGVGAIAGVPLLATRVFKNLSNFTKTLNSMKNVDNAITTILGMKNLKQGIQGIKTAKDALSFSKAGIKTIGGAYIQFRMASGEALIEATETAHSLKENLLEQYKRENGRDAEGKDLEDIELASIGAAKSTYWANTAILMASNAIQSHNIFNTYKSLRGLPTMAADASRVAKRAFYDKTSKTFMTFGELSKKRRAGIIAGKSAKFLASNSLSEGLEESSQYIIGQAAQDYFSKKYNKDVFTITDSIGKGLKDAYTTDEGIDNFAMGAMSGLLMSSLGSAVKGVAFKGRTKLDKERAETFVDNLNTEFAKILKIEHLFSPEAQNASAQIQNASDIEEQASLGNKKNVIDLKRRALVQSVIATSRSGRYDLFVDRLKDQLNLTDEEFKAQYGLDAVDNNKKTHTQYITDALIEADKIKNAYESINEKYKNPFSNYVKEPVGSTKWALGFRKYNAYELAKENAVLHLDRIQNAHDRILELDTQLRVNFKVEPQHIYDLIKKEARQDRKRTLNEENKSLKDLTDKESKKQLAKNEKELSFIEEYEEFIKDLTGAKREDADFKGFVYEYISYYRDPKNTQGSSSLNVKNGYEVFKDVLELENDINESVIALNDLEAPLALSEEEFANYETMVDEIKKKAEIDLEEAMKPQEETPDVQPIAEDEVEFVKPEVSPEEGKAEPHPADVVNANKKLDEWQGKVLEGAELENLNDILAEIGSLSTTDKLITDFAFIESGYIQEDGKINKFKNISDAIEKYKDGLIILSKKYLSEPITDIKIEANKPGLTFTYKGFTYKHNNFLFKEFLFEAPNFVNTGEIVMAPIVETSEGARSLDLSAIAKFFYVINENILREYKSKYGDFTSAPIAAVEDTVVEPTNKQPVKQKREVIEKTISDNPNGIFEITYINAKGEVSKRIIKVVSHSEDGNIITAWDSKRKAQDITFTVANIQTILVKEKDYNLLNTANVKYYNDLFGIVVSSWFDLSEPIDLNLSTEEVNTLRKQLDIEEDGSSAPNILRTTSDEMKEGKLDSPVIKRNVKLKNILLEKQRNGESLSAQGIYISFTLDNGTSLPQEDDYAKRATAGEIEGSLIPVVGVLTNKEGKILAFNDDGSIIENPTAEDVREKALKFQIPSRDRISEYKRKYIDKLHKTNPSATEAEKKEKQKKYEALADAEIKVLNKLKDGLRSVYKDKGEIKISKPYDILRFSNGLSSSPKVQTRTTTVANKISNFRIDLVATNKDKGGVFAIIDGVNHILYIDSLSQDTKEVIKYILNPGENPNFPPELQNIDDRLNFLRSIFYTPIANKLYLGINKEKGTIEALNGTFPLEGQEINDFVDNIKVNLNIDKTLLTQHLDQPFNFYTKTEKGLEKVDVGTYKDFVINNSRIEIDKEDASTDRLNIYASFGNTPIVQSVKESEKMPALTDLPESLFDTGGAKVMPSKKADIERRRQEELDNVGIHTKHPKGSKEYREDRDYQLRETSILKEINAKYDAELAVLETSQKNKPSSEASLGIETQEATDIDPLEAGPLGSMGDPNPTNKKLYKLKDSFKDLKLIANNPIRGLNKVINAMDAIIALYAKNNNISIEHLFYNSDVRLSAYKFVKDNFEILFAENNKNHTKDKKELYKYVVDNFADFLNVHTKKGSINPQGFKGSIIEIDSTTGEFFEKYADTDDLVALSDGSYGRAAEWDRTGTEEDSKDVASKQSRFLVKSLVKSTLQDGRLIYQLNDLGLLETVDFASTWTMLSMELEGSMNPEEMYDKLEELKDQQPEVFQLLEKLPPAKNIEKAEDQMLKNKFWQDLNRTLVPYHLALIDESGRTKFIRGTSKARNILLNKYKLDLIEQVNKDDSFVSSDENFKPVLDIQLLYNAYLGDKAEFPVTLNAKTEKERDDYADNRIAFLQDFGFSLSQKTIESEDFKKEMQSNIVFASLAKSINDIITKGGVTKLSDPIGQLIKPYTKTDDKGNKSKITNGNQQDIYKILDLELNNSGVYYSGSVINASNKTVYELSVNNFLTILKNNLNNVKKYPTYQSLIAAQEWKYLNIDTNPYAKSSIYLNSMFILDVPKNNNLYGQRRVINNQPITFELLNYGGLNQQNSDEFSANEGTVTTKLNPEDKLLMDINVLLSNGYSENIRSADKSSSFANRPSLIFVHNSTASASNGPVISLNKFTLFDSILNGKGSMQLESLGDTIGSSIYLKYLQSEIRNVIKYKLGIGNNLSISDNMDLYKDQASKLYMFEDILNKNVQKELIDFINKQTANKEYSPILENEIYESAAKLISKKEFSEDIARHFIKRTNALYDTLVNKYNLSEEMLDRIFAQHHGFDVQNNKQKLTIKEILLAYSVNQEISNIEQQNLIYGTFALFKDPFKRLPMFTSHGTIAATDEETLNWYNNHDQNYRLEERVLKAELKIEQPARVASNIVRSSVFADVTNQSKYFKDYKAFFQKEGVDIEALSKFDTEQVEPDAQGLCTLDFYRLMKGRMGMWDMKHERVYKKVVNKIPLTEDEMYYFMPMKLGYGGPLNIDNLHTAGYHKFSVIPILPNVIGNDSNVEQIRQKMLLEGVDYITFASASKGTTLTKVDENGNRSLPELYLNKNRELNPDPFLVTESFYHFYKEQLRIDPDQKKEVIFGSQFRKLLFLNKFNNSVPVDSDLKRTEWEALSEKEKINSSPIYKSFKKYTSAIESITAQKKHQLLKVLTMEETKEGEYIIKDPSKFTDYIREQAEKRNLPQSAVEHFKVDKATNKFVNNIETAKNKVVLQSMLLSLVNNQLIRQRINGESLVQVASTLFEKAITQDDQTPGKRLQFYRIETNEVDGKEETKLLPMEIMVSFSNHYKPLLQLTHSDGKKIKTLGRLNEMLENNDFLKNNEKALTMIAYRIPTQGLNSIENMRIVRFLPQETGNQIVLPSEITVKAGSDFDIDKLNIIRYNFREVPETPLKLEDYKAINKSFFEKAQDGNTILSNEYLPDRDINGVYGIKTIMQEVEFYGSIEALDEKSSVIFELLEEKLKEYVEDREMTLKTSQKGIQKHYNDIVDLANETLQTKESIANILNPNTTNIIEHKVAEQIKIKTGVRKTDTTGTSKINPLVILEKFIAFLQGKETLSIAAVTNTYTQLLQQAGAYALNKYKYRADHDELETLLFLDHNKVTIDGKTHIDLANSYDVTGTILKSELFSQYINAYVDIAKEPFIFYMNATKDVAPVLFLMSHMGVGVMNGAYLVNQPSIRKHMDKMQNFSSHYHKAFNRDRFENDYGTLSFSQFEMRTVVDSLREYGLDIELFVRRDPRRKDISERVFNSETQRLLKQYIKRIPNALSIDSLSRLSNEDKDVQIASLLQFIELKRQATVFRSVQSTINFDTNPSSSVNEAALSVIDYARVTDDNSQNYIPAKIVRKMVEGSILSSFRVQPLIEKMYSSLSPLLTSEAFKHQLSLLYNNTPGLKKDKNTKANMIRYYENELLMFALQNYVNKNGSTFYDENYHLLDTNSDDNIYKQFAKLREDLPDLFNNSKHRATFKLLNNISFANVELKTGERDDKDRIQAAAWEGSKFDADLINEMEQEWDFYANLKDNTPSMNEKKEALQSFYNNLLKASLLTYGINKYPGSLTDIIPADMYEDIMQPAIEEALRQFTKGETLSKKAEQDESLYLYNAFVDADYNTLFLQNNPRFVNGARGTRGGKFFKDYRVTTKSASIEDSTKDDSSNQVDPYENNEDSNSNLEEKGVPLQLQINFEEGVENNKRTTGSSDNSITHESIKTYLSNLRKSEKTYVGEEPGDIVFEWDKQSLWVSKSSNEQSDFDKEQSFLEEAIKQSIALQSFNTVDISYMSARLLILRIIRREANILSTSILDVLRERKYKVVRRSTSRASYDPSNNTYSVNIHIGENEEYNTYEKLSEVLNNVALEEVLHKIAFDNTSKEEIAAIVSEISPEERQIIHNMYYGQDSYDGNQLSDFQLAHEYIRQILQQRLTGSITELPVVNIFKPAILSFIKKLLNRLLNAFSKKPIDSVTKQVIERLENIINNKGVNVTTASKDFINDDYSSYAYIHSDGTLVKQKITVLNVFRNQKVKNKNDVFEGDIVSFTVDNAPMNMQKVIGSIINDRFIVIARLTNFGWKSEKGTLNLYNLPEFHELEINNLIKELNDFKIEAKSKVFGEVDSLYTFLGYYNISDFIRAKIKFKSFLTTKRFKSKEELFNYIDTFYDEKIREVHENFDYLINNKQEVIEQPIQNKEGIAVKLGRSKGNIQNINVWYNGKQIINEDSPYVMTIQYLNNEAIVGNISIPKEYQGKGLAKYIYQAAADLIQKPIVNSLKYKKELGEYYGQSEAGSRVWKNRTQFTPKFVEQPIQNKEGIDFVFEQSPELTSIGSKEQYSSYISTIFPESKVKDIVYHGSNVKFDKFDITKADKGGSLSFWLPKGYYFSDHYATANAYSDKKGAIYPAILNLNSPTIIENPNKKGYGIGDILRDYIKFPDSGRTNKEVSDAIEKLKSDLLKKGDGVIIKDVFDMPQGSSFTPIHHWQEFERKDETDTLVVFEPEQIHILGSKQDIEGFKKFVEQPINKDIKDDFDKFKEVFLNTFSIIIDSTDNWTISSELSTKDRAKAVNDIRNNKVTAASKKLEELIKNTYESGTVFINRGRGITTEHSYMNAKTFFGLDDNGNTLNASNVGSLGDDPLIGKQIPFLENKGLYKERNLTNTEGTELKLFLKESKTLEKWVATLNKKWPYHFAIRPTPKGFFVILMYPKDVLDKIESPKVDNNQTINVQNAIKNSLPTEISKAVTVVKDVPLDILGRNDLLLSIKEILEDNGVKDEILINWVGINKDKIGSIKSITSEQQINNIIENRYTKLKNTENHPALKSNKLALESFNKWAEALKNYPAPFREIMLSHAVKYLNPQRRAKYVLQLSEVALTNAYGIIVNKPHELNRIGKLYDQEVLKTVGDAVGHEPSASGNGYWVHIPRVSKGNGIQYHTKINDLSNDNKAPGKFSVDWISNVEDDGGTDFFNTREQAEDYILKLTGETKDNSAQHKVNVELLRKLSPSTWCTASGMASHYVENYDNYLLIVNGITVAGIEAKSPPNSEVNATVINKLQKQIDAINSGKPIIEKNEGNILPEIYIDNILIETPRKTKGQFDKERSLNTLRRGLSEIKDGKTEVKEVTSRANNGTASIDHLDDILAFFEKHNLDTDNESINRAKRAKDKGFADVDQQEDEEFYDGEPFDAEREWGYNYEADYDEPEIDEEQERWQEEEFRVSQIDTLEEVLKEIEEDGGLSIMSHFMVLSQKFRDNETIANLAINADAHNITHVSQTVPFYNGLATKAVIKNPYVFTYLSEEKKELPGLREMFNEHERDRANMQNDDLPFSKTNNNQIQGYYDAKNDKVVVVASNTPVNEAAKVAIHEIAHRGMIRMAKDLGGTKEFNQILLNAEEQLMRKLPELLKRTGHKNKESLVLDYGFDIKTEEGKVKLLSELAARWAETLVDKPKPSWWKDFLTSIKNWITKFTGKALTESEVNELVGGFVKYGTRQITNKIDNGQLSLFQKKDLDENDGVFTECGI